MMISQILFESRSFCVYELPRIEVPVTVPMDETGLPEFSVAPCGIERIEDLCRCRSLARSERDASLFTGRFLTGSMCFMLCHGNRIAGFGWANASSNPLEDSDRYRLDLGKDGAYLWDFFICSDFRGRSLYQFFLKGVQNDLAAMGLTRYIIKVDPKDERSIQQHLSIGAVLVEKVHYRCRFGLTLYHIENPSGTVSLSGSYRSKRIIERDFSSRKR
jgi:hypothetical protein